jgi:hypothetical protein
LGTFTVCVLLTACLYYVLEDTAHSNGNLIPIGDLLTNLHVNRRQVTNEHSHRVIVRPTRVLDTCDKSPNGLLLLSVVLIAPHYFQKRQVIRGTWASQSQRVASDSSAMMRVVFAIGLSGNQSVNRMIRAEARRHGDILQEDFVDSYRNLTLKTMMIFKWASEQCAHARYLLRINDDVAVNTPKLMTYLHSTKRNLTLYLSLSLSFLPFSNNYIM